MLDDKGFDLWADGYDIDVGVSDESNTYPFAGYKEILGSIFSIIMEKRGASVLDIGFGTGTLLTKLYENGCEVYGQDFSGRMIETAQKKMPGARLYKGDFSNGLVGELKERKYDFIVATYSLHHLTDEQKTAFISGLPERLNEGGKVLIGDVAFLGREEMERCRAEAGDEWDDEEYYFLIDEMRRAFPALGYCPVTYCSGLITLS